MALAIAGACGHPSGHPHATGPTATPAPTGQPPGPAPTQDCSIVVHDDSFVVDGERFTPEGSEAVAQLVLRDGSTLVAGDAQLWLVDCRRTPKVKQLIASPDASVRSGRLAADEHTFVFANGHGISALDLTTLTTRELYATPNDEPPGFCGMIAKPGTAAATPHARDEITGFADDGRTLLLQRRWGCHYPDAYAYALVDWADPAKAKAHPARPIYDVAADAKGTLWLGDGGGLWSSRDRGATWKRVAIKGDDGAGVDIFADSKRAGALVVRTAKGTEISEGDRGSDFPGPVFRTRDGGATWSKVTLPMPVVAALAVSDGNVDHLLVATGEPDEDETSEEAPPEGQEGPLVQRVDQGANRFRLNDPPRRAPVGWRATTDGKTWTKAAAPPARKRNVNLGADTFESTPDGLYRTHAGKRELVTPLLTKPYPNDAF